MFQLLRTLTTVSLLILMSQCKSRNSSSDLASSPIDLTISSNKIFYWREASSLYLGHCLITETRLARDTCQFQIKRAPASQVFSAISLLSQSVPANIVSLGSLSRTLGEGLSQKELHDRFSAIASDFESEFQSAFTFPGSPLLSGIGFVCGVFKSGVRCWGDPNHVVLKTVPPNHIYKPVSSLTRGPDAYTVCGIFKDRGFYCWGKYNFGSANFPELGSYDDLRGIICRSTACAIWNDQTIKIFRTNTDPLEENIKNDVKISQLDEVKMPKNGYTVLHFSPGFEKKSHTLELRDQTLVNGKAMALTNFYCKQCISSQLSGEWPNIFGESRSVTGSPKCCYLRSSFKLECNENCSFPESKESQFKETWYPIRAFTIEYNFLCLYTDKLKCEGDSNVVDSTPDTSNDPLILTLE